MKQTNDGPWVLAETVQSSRCNLFDMTPGKEHQVATIISGSSTELLRFQQSLSLIRAAPRLHACLRETHQVLDQYKFVQSPFIQELRQTIESLLLDIDRPL